MHEQSMTPSRRGGLLIVDDHPLYRDALCVLFDRMPELEVIAAVGSAAEALDVARTHDLELAIIDVVLTSSSGIGLTKRLKDQQPRCKVLGISAHDDPVRAAAMFRAGADGYAIKTQGAEDIVDAVRCVRESTRYLSPAIDAAKVATLADSEETNPLERLTPREREVFDLLVGGEANADIAARLFIARRTVETHRQNIMKKLGVRSAADLVRLAFTLGT